MVFEEVWLQEVFLNSVSPKLLLHCESCSKALRSPSSVLHLTPVSDLEHTDQTGEVPDFAGTAE